MKLFRNLIVSILFTLGCCTADSTNLDVESSSSIALDEFLNIFQNCLVHLLNYQGLDVISTRIPLAITKLPSLIPIGKKPRGVHYMRFLYSTQVRSRCVAQFYVAPSIYPYFENAENDSNNFDFHDLNQRGAGENLDVKYSLNVPSPFSELFGPPSLREPVYETRGKYTILVRLPEDSVKEWVDAYSESIFRKQITARGIILTLKRYSPFEPLRIKDQLEIVNQFHLMRFMVTRIPMRIDVFRMHIHILDKEINRVNDMDANLETKWSVKIMPSKGVKTVIPHFINKILESGTVGLHVAATLLRPNSNLQEGLENFVFAKLILGPNMTTLQTYGSRTPVIYFNSPRATFFPGESKQLALITCSDKLIETYMPGIWGFYAMLLSQFEPRIWLGIGLAYPLPALLFGLLYFCTKISKMHGRKPMSHASFSIGLHNLVDQCVDRKWNHRRFGFMACVAVPWLLGAVLFSHAFRGNNMHSLSAPTVIRHRQWLSFYTAQHLKLQMVTDIGVYDDNMQDIRNFFDFHGDYSELARIISTNDSIILASWEGRINAVESIIKSDWTKCRWKGPTVGGGYYYSRNWRFMEAMSGNGGGWAIYNL